MTKHLLYSWLITSILLISGSFNFQSLALSDDDPSKRYFYGGYFGVELGMINQFEVSPLLGYKILPRWHAGIGAKYQYHHNKRLDQVFRSHIFGPLVSTDLIVIKDLDDLLPFRFIDGSLFIHAEMNYLSLPTNHFDTKNEHPDKGRFFRPTWLTGAGLRVQAGTESYFHVLLMVDVSGHTRLLYPNPVLRFGLMF